MLARPTRFVISRRSIMWWRSRLRCERMQRTFIGACESAACMWFAFAQPTLRVGRLRHDRAIPIINLFPGPERHVLSSDVIVKLLKIFDPVRRPGHIGMHP